MSRVLINNTEVRFINEPELHDQISPNGASFTIELLGLFPSFLGATVQVYDSNNDLIGKGHVSKENVEIRTRSKTILEVIDPSWFLDHTPITGNFNDTFENTLILLRQLSGVSDIIADYHYKINPNLKTKNVAFSAQLNSWKDCIQRAIDGTGVPLTFGIPLGKTYIQINQLGYGDDAPIPIVRLDSLYTTRCLHLNDISYQIIPPLASEIDLYGRNGLLTTNNSSINPLDLINYTSVGSDNYGILETAHEVWKILVSKPSIGGCTVVVSVSGNNYVQYNQSNKLDFEIPNLTTDPHGAAQLVYSATMTAVKSTSTVCFFSQGQLTGAATGTIDITVNGDSLYSANLSTTAHENKTIINSLSAYIDQTVDIVVTVTIPTQTVSTYIFARQIIDANCCQINTIIGLGFSVGGGFNGDGGDALSTQLNTPMSMRMLSDGRLVFWDTGNRRIRRLELDNTITTIIGDGTDPSSPPTNGTPATSLKIGLNFRLDIYNDEVYFIISDYAQVGKINSSGNWEIIYTQSGNNFLFAICVDSTGIIYYSDVRSGQEKIYKLEFISGSWVRTHYAGNGNSGWTGDGGPATSAAIEEVRDLCVDSNNNLYLVSDNLTVRKINKSDGIITTIAGKVGAGGTNNFGVDATTFYLSRPGAISIRGDNLYISDSGLAQILVVDLTTGIIDKFAGSNNSSGYRGDGGSPLTAGFRLGGVNAAAGVFADPNSDSIFIADGVNQVIREVSCI